MSVDELTAYAASATEWIHLLVFALFAVTCILVMALDRVHRGCDVCVHCIRRLNDEIAARNAERDRFAASRWFGSKKVVPPEEGPRGPEDGDAGPSST